MIRFPLISFKKQLVNKIIGSEGRTRVETMQNILLRFNVEGNDKEIGCSLMGIRKTVSVMIW